MKTIDLSDAFRIAATVEIAVDAISPQAKELSNLWHSQERIKLTNPNFSGEYLVTCQAIESSAAGLVTHYTLNLVGGLEK